MSNVVPSSGIAWYLQIRPEGDVADHISLHVEDWERQLHQRASNWLPAARAAIESTYRNCAADGWDGPDSIGVLRAAADNACRLLDWVYCELPEGLSAPEISATPDGEIAMDWLVDGTWLLSLNVGAHENMNYAGQFPDGQTHHGYLPYGLNALTFQAAVSELCRLIRKLHGI